MATPADATRVDTEEQETTSVADAVDGLARIKADRKTAAPHHLFALQRWAGNAALAGTMGDRPIWAKATPSVAVQRHGVEGAPPAPAADEIAEEDAEGVQTQRALQTVPLQRSWGAAGGPVVQRWKKAMPKGMKAPPTWAKTAPSPTAKGAKGAAKGKGVLAAKRVKLGPLKLSAKEMPADGGATSITASVAGARKVVWSVSGSPAAKVDPDTGVISAGTDTGGVEHVPVTVTATDAEVPEAVSTGSFTLWNADVWHAKADVAALMQSGPLAQKGMMKGLNGKYDASWSPKGHLLSIEVPVNFSHPDDPIRKTMSKKQVEARNARVSAERRSFIRQAEGQWSGRYAFTNVRLPASQWGALGPVAVSVKVVRAKAAAGYFTVNFKTKTKGTSAVLRPNLDMFKGSLTPQQAFVAGVLVGERQRLEAITPTVNVAKDGSIPGASQASIRFLGTYIKRLGQPPVKLSLVGRGRNAKDGTFRAKAVADLLQNSGVKAPHQVVTTTDSGIFNRSRVKITPTVDPAYANMQDTTAHEFGHMLGLPDEYVGGTRVIGDKLSTYDRLDKAFGSDYANAAGRVTSDSASLMEGGSQVRMQHYIHFWDTLIALSNLHPTAPKTKFGDADWKFHE